MNLVSLAYFVCSVKVQIYIEIDDTLKLYILFYDENKHNQIGEFIKDEQSNVFFFQRLAKKYKKSVVQIVLRWNIQRNTVVIPKTSKLERLKENFQVFDFKLTKEDMDLIKTIDRKYQTNQPGKYWGIDVYA